MVDAEIIIVGGGPAGAACAWQLKRAGWQVVILDKAVFPRVKVCAGWIQPGVFAMLGASPRDYPSLLVSFNALWFHFPGVTVPVPTRQYAVRRLEFDHWLLQRAGVPVYPHRVKKIIRTGTGFVIDDTWQCRYLVGAGGTHCPVRGALFARCRPRQPDALIMAVEREYPCHVARDLRDNRCHLWMHHKGVPGYGWVVPKGRGWVNIGIGGKAVKLQQRGVTIMDHWHGFVRDLVNKGQLRKAPPPPRGHRYYLKQGPGMARSENAFLAGDAAGCSTWDMGEGIFGAVAGGLGVANWIVGGKGPKAPSIPHLSLPRMIAGI